jgi:hypothetical protein
MKKRSKITPGRGEGSLASEGFLMARRLFKWWWLKFACVVLAFAIVVELLTRPGTSPSVFSTVNDVAVLTHAKKNGAHFAYRIGRRCELCIRGTYANRDIKTGEVVFSLPLSYGIQLVERRHIAHVAELAYYFLLQVHLSPDFNRSHPHFWESMPTSDDLLHSATLDPAQIAMLHMPHLETDLHQYQLVIEAIYNGSAAVGQDVRLPPLASLLDNDAVSLSTFKHVVGLVDSRMYNVLGKKYMFPVMDMTNFAIGYDNLAPPEYNGTHMLQFAIRGIKRGSELLWNYSPHALHRPDVSIRTYGEIYCSLCILPSELKNPSIHTHV